MDANALQGYMRSKLPKDIRAEAFERRNEGKIIANIGVSHYVEYPLTMSTHNGASDAVVREMTQNLIDRLKDTVHELESSLQ